MNLIKDLAISYIKQLSCMQPTLPTRVRILVRSPRNMTLAATGLLVRCRQHFILGTLNNRLFTGALMKLDSILKTEEGSWLPLFRGERRDMTLWFCVKCPSSQQIDHCQASPGEDRSPRKRGRVLSRTFPWSMLDNIFKQGSGMGHLPRCLSDNLCDLIAERFVYLALRRKQKFT